MMMAFPVQEHFEKALISLRTGDYHMVNVRGQRPTNSGFFELPLEAEEEAFARLVSYLYEYGVNHQWGGVTEIGVPEEGLSEDVQAYFDSYDLECQHGFVGLIGFAALVTAGLLELPTEVEDPSSISTDTLKEWMQEHFHVGKMGEVPIYFNEEMGSHIAFSSAPDTVGSFNRIGDYACLLVHNGERSLIILRVGLQNDEDVSGSDISGSTEERQEEPGD
jgi:hypothetical protein